MNVHMSLVSHLSQRIPCSERPNAVPVRIFQTITYKMYGLTILAGNCHSSYDTLHKHKKGEFHYNQQVPNPIKNKKISKTLNRGKSSSYDGDFTYHFIMFRYQDNLVENSFLLRNYLN